MTFKVFSNQSNSIIYLQSFHMNMEALKNAKLVKGWTTKFLRAAF